MMQLVLLNNENEIDIIVIVVAICLHNVLINFCLNPFFNVRYGGKCRLHIK